MTIEKHMLLPSRKALAARLVHIEASLPLEGQFNNDNALGTYRELDFKLGRILEEESKKQRKNRLNNNNEILDASLNHFLGRLRKHARADLEDHPRLYKILRRAMSAEAKKMACVPCSTRAPQVCDGGKYDDELVSLGGACVAPLKEMFELARDIAVHYYKTYGTLMSGNPEVVFVTRYENDKPHDFPVDFYVGGLTDYADSPLLTRARVALLIQSEHFDTATYLSSLYALFHECFVHAFQGITPKIPKRTAAKPEERFTEGWMDWVAIKVLEKVLDGEASVPFSNLRFIPEKRAHAQDFHRARIKTTGAQISQYAGQLSNGAKTAEKVLRVFENYPKPGFDPWRSFLQLSFDLNMMSDFTADQRDNLVGALQYLEENRQRHTILCRKITKYLVDNNLREFIDAMQQLKTTWAH